MTHASAHNHDLEDHIEDLRKLDDLRKRSGQFRDDGIKVLKAHKNDLLRSQDWIFDVALAIRALSIKFDLPFEDKKEQKEYLDTIFDLGKDLQTCTLDDIIKDKHSVLAAARVLRALIACPGGAFSRTAMVCYYWIIREIYTAEGSDWNTGGVRAAPDGAVSAFVTSECVHALLSFAEAQQKTGDFVEEVSKFQKRMDHLKQLEDNTNSNGLNELNKWIKDEKERLSLSLSLTLQRLSRYLVLPIELSGSKTLEEPVSNISDSDKFSFDRYVINFFIPEENKFEELEKFSNEFLNKDLQQKLINVKENFSKAHEEIETYRKKEKNGKECRAIMKSESAHLIAESAIKVALEHVEKTIKFFDDNDVDADSQGCFYKLKKELNRAAEQVNHLLRPSMNYLGTVLDRELATVSLGEQWDWQPAELACAATAYGRLSCLSGKWTEDARFGRAIDQLSKAISRYGLIPNKRPYHTMRHENSYYYFSNSVALTALAHLLRNLTEPEIKSDLIEKMLRFFEEIRATKSFDDWRFSKEEIQKIEKNKKSANGDDELYVIKEYVDILDNYRGNSALAGKFKEIFHLPKSITDEKSIIDEKDVTEGFWEILVVLLNQILEDEETYKNYIFPENDNSKYKREVERLKNDLSKKKDNDKLIRLNRLVLEHAYQKLIPKSDAVEFSSDKPIGWCRDHSPLIPRKTDLAATAHAVFALAEINEMLDTRINYMILEHFSVKKKNKELNSDLKLDSLFYPDYGLCLAPREDTFETKCPRWIEEKDWPTEGVQRRESVAITLQQICGHVLRVFLPKKYKPIHSLVLHGPAGTGKTTLVEALAVTCDVPLVEVTPSDLVKRGEENIEQRARAVFYALSLLTRAVILFDEFDPVLKRRDASNNSPLNVFSFLTPGMLPKLKDLHDRAKKRSVAYVLVTNLIGELDEAAVRQGRFDERLGIYPPDLLSRTGRFLDQIYDDIVGNKGQFKSDVPWDCIVNIIKQTEGKGMTALAKLGWFTIPDKKEKRKQLKEKSSDTPYRLFHLRTIDQSQYMTEKNEFIWPEPDDMLKGILGMGRTAVKECLQWQWINEWDGKLRPDKEADFSCQSLNEALKMAYSLTKMPQPEYVESSRSGRRRSR